MKTYTKLAGLSLITAVLMMTPLAYAATSPTLGMADSFSILTGTYVNTTAGTTINGDLGYTTSPATTPTVNGATHVADATYNQAGIDQGTALSDLNSQSCTFTFAPGAIDLASDTTHGTVGVYAPGVYCISGAASIGGGGTITLTGTGTYIFRMTGALTTSAGSVVAAAGGATASNIWWAPGAATVAGANSTFLGNDIDASGITLGNLVVWTGRALAFGGTVSTNNDSISSAALSGSGGTGTGNASSSVSAALSTSTPGLPNTGGSEPSHSYGAIYLVLLGTFVTGLLLARVVLKRA